MISTLVEDVLLMLGFDFQDKKYYKTGFPYYLFIVDGDIQVRDIGTSETITYFDNINDLRLFYKLVTKRELQ